MLKVILESCSRHETTTTDNNTNNKRTNQRKRSQHAQKQAAKHKSMLAKDGDDDADDLSKPKIVIEDLGGAPADLDDEDHPEDGKGPRKIQNHN